ncbi:MAG TPA: FHA domain-containing protein, partial [Thermoanaerobaculia bacterium]|nr:FHA domain-containing protein [Thermoanaerobaculia bacterium]
MPTLTIKTGAHAGQVLRFQKDVEIGRASHLGLPIDDPTISRRHASITFSRDAWWLADLGSQNGTAINGQK